MSRLISSILSIALLSLACDPARAQTTQAALSAELQGLISDLQSDNPARWQSAGKAFAKLGSDAAPAAPALVRFLDAGPIPDQMMMHVTRISRSLVAGEALVRIGPAVIPTVEEALFHAAPEVRVNAVWVLSKLGADRNLDALVRAASDPAPRVRVAAVDALGSSNHHRAIDARITALANPDAAVRRTAVAGFSEFKTDEATTLEQIVRAILPLLHDPERKTRLEVVETLGNLGSRAAVPAMIEALAAARMDDQFSIIRSLGQLQDRRATAPLLDLLDRANQPRREMAIVFATMVALGELKDPLATNALVSLLDHPNDGVKAEAAKALGRIGDRRAIPKLIPLLQSGTDRTVGAAAAALGGMPDARAIEPLIEALKVKRSYEEIDSRNATDAIAAALGQIGDPKAIDPLVDLFFDPGGYRYEPDVHDALERIHDPRVVLALGDRLAEREKDWNDPAAALLGELTGVDRFSRRKEFLNWWSRHRSRYADSPATTQAAPK